MATFTFLAILLGITIDLIIKHYRMKNKIGFNLVFAMMAFVLGLGLLREFDFENFIFRKKVLGFLYLIVFIISVFLTFKKKKETDGK